MAVVFLTRLVLFVFLRRFDCRADPAVAGAAVPSAAGGDQDDIVDEFAYIIFDKL